MKGVFEVNPGSYLYNTFTLCHTNFEKNEKLYAKTNLTHDLLIIAHL